MARKRKKQVKLFISRVSLTIVVIGLIGFMLLYLALRFGNTLPDRFSFWLSAVGTFSIIGYAICFIISLRSMAWHEFSVIWRLLSLVISFVNLIAWVGLYLIGIMTNF